MKKTLSLLLALVMVIGLFPVFADEAPAALTAEEAGAILKGYGAIKGDLSGDLMIDKELKRQDAVVILTRLMGKEADALATKADPSFTDITIDYYKPFLAFAEANKWIEGRGDKKFGFHDLVTLKEFSAMLLRALGYDTTGENYAKVMDLAKELKLFNGVTLKEDDKLVRGNAFILMNNTLETNPKGEDKALVYKLGYKEVPKPQHLTVLSAEAAGLKAIDIKFSKEVSEKSLKGISLKNKKNKKVGFEASVIEPMTVRLILNDKAVQDEALKLVVEGVMTVDMKEAVEKFEASIFMTDVTRPEVLGVEALNPKTLLVKVSEPVDKDVKSFATLQEFKIDGKALVGKVASDLEKNELVVELYTALKPGDYKLEVSGLKDFSGLTTKTQEFDITVVEDKDAPVVTEASMVNVKTVKVVFNEPLSQKGKFRVDGKDVTPASNIVLSKDKRTVTLTLTDALGMGAITEVKVEHKGQKDIMGNEVKDWAKFTFKVEDDTTLPEVKSVEVDGTKIIVTFSKNMDTSKGFFTLKKGDKIAIAKTKAEGKFKKDDASVLEIDAGAALSGASASAYTLILEGFVDGTVRKNEMAKVEHAIEGGDTKSPTVEKEYAVENNGNATKILKIKIFFSEEMDSATLLDKKNFTFESYEYDGQPAKANLRADAVDSKFDFSLEQGGKVLVIEANDVKVKTVKKITLVGLKDKAGNPLTGNNVVEPFASGDQTVVADFIKEGDVYVIKAVFTQPIEYMGEAFKLTADNKSLNLKHRNQSDDNLTHYFDFDQTGVKADAKKDAHELKLELVNGDLAKSVYGKPAVAPALGKVNDKVAPSVVKNDDGTAKIEVVNTDYKSVKVYFDENLNNNEADQKISLADKDGVVLGSQLENLTDKDYIQVKLNPEAQFKNGTYKLTLINISDQVAAPDQNVATDLGTVDVKVASAGAVIDSVVKPGLVLTNELKVKTTFAIDYKAGENAASTFGQFKASYVRGAAAPVNLNVSAIADITGDGGKEIKLTIDNTTFQAGDIITVEYLSEGKLVDKVNTDIALPSKTVTVTQ